MSPFTVTANWHWSGDEQVRDDCRVGIRRRVVHGGPGRVQSRCRAARVPFI